MGLNWRGAASSLPSAAADTGCSRCLHLQLTELRQPPFPREGDARELPLTQFRRLISSFKLNFWSGLQLSLTKLRVKNSFLAAFFFGVQSENAKEIDTGRWGKKKASL